MPADVVIRVATVTDVEAVASIYDHYVAHTVITFEEETVDTSEFLIYLLFDGGMRELSHQAPHPNSDSTTKIQAITMGNRSK